MGLRSGDCGKVHVVLEKLWGVFWGHCGAPVCLRGQGGADLMQVYRVGRTPPGLNIPTTSLQRFAALHYHFLSLHTTFCYCQKSQKLGPSVNTGFSHSIHCGIFLCPSPPWKSPSLRSSLLSPLTELFCIDGSLAVSPEVQIIFLIVCSGLVHLQSAVEHLVLMQGFPVSRCCLAPLQYAVYSWLQTGWAAEANSVSQTQKIWHFE